MILQQALLRYMHYSFQQTVKLVYSSPRRMMTPAPGAVLVDCGCNNGDYTRHLGGILGTERVYGLEFNRGLADTASSKGVRVLRGDLNQAIPLGSNSVDVVTAFNVLEHLVETQRFLDEMYRVLVPGGYTIINTPNLASWHNIAALLLGLQPFSGPNITSMQDADVALVRRLHRRTYGLPEEAEHIAAAEPERHRHIVVVAFRSLVRALQRTGFQVETALGYGYYPLPPFLAWVASQVDPAHAHHMVIKARKPAA